MNGWYSRLSPDGLHVVSGSGDWWLDNRAMGPGWTPVWWDEDRVLLNRGGGLWAYILDTDEHVELVPGARVNGLAAGGGRYAWYGTGAQGTGIYRDGGTYRAGLDPAVYGDHLAWVSEVGDALWVDDLLVRRAAIRTITTPPCVRASALGLTWIEYHGDRLEAWGLLWGGEPQHLAPTWRDCYCAVPIVGPHGIPWLLVSDGVRLMLVPRGAHVGKLVAEDEILHPDGAWTGEYWRIVWNDPQGHRFEATAYPDAALTDFMADAPAPAPPPEIGFTLWPGGSRTAPCIVEAVLTSKVRIQTHRWLKGPQGAALLAIDGADTDTHEYEFDTAGRFDLGLRAQGDDGALIPVPRQTVTITAPPQPAHLTGVQTGFGCPIVGTSDVYRELRGFGWSLMRVETARVGPRRPNDFEYQTDAALTRVILDEVREADCEPLIIAGASHVAGLPHWPRLKVELYNEADLAMTAAAYVQAIRPVLELCYDRGYDVYTSGISNPSPIALCWLAEVLKALPAWVNCCYHRYPQDPWDVASVPRTPYRSRAEEFAALWAAVQTGMPAGQKRKLICSECGYNQAWFEQGWWIFKRRRRLSDQEVLERVRAELAYQREAGILASIYYQIDEDPADLKGVFGLRRRVGSGVIWKPVARVNLA